MHVCLSLCLLSSCLLPVLAILPSSSLGTVVSLPSVTIFFLSLSFFHSLHQCLYLPPLTLTNCDTYNIYCCAVTFVFLSLTGSNGLVSHHTILVGCGFDTIVTSYMHYHMKCALPFSSLVKTCYLLPGQGEEMK